jgi:hypothetical protein
MNQLPTIYLAGPMSGRPGFNHEAFHAEAKRLRDAGHGVLNPAECDGGTTDKPWSFYMRKALAMLVQADEVLALSGWEQSRGARIEIRLALWLGMTVRRQGSGHPVSSYDIPPEAHAPRIYLDPPAPEPISETVCQEADRLVSGDRGSAYGHPLDNFTHAGRLWAPILGLDEVTPEQVALCMVQVKVSRECHKSKRDNSVDIAGYAKCLDLVREEKARRAS